MKISTQAEIERDEVGSPDVDYGRIVGLREFAQMVLEDGHYTTYFAPYIYDENGEAAKNPLYSIAYEPLRLMFSRLLRLGIMTEDEIRRFRGKVHGTVQRCHSLAKSRFEHYIIDSMEKYLGTVVGSHTLKGFFFRALTENRKTLRFLRGEEEKKRWSIFR